MRFPTNSLFPVMALALPAGYGSDYLAEVPTVLSPK